MKYLKPLMNKEEVDFVPLFYRLNNPKDNKSLENLLETCLHISVKDAIHLQVMELIKSRNPGTDFANNELALLANEHLQNLGNEKYGVWVYYPWLNRLVHILDEEEFIEVRTNRNQYKITPKEKDILAQQKVGVIGLSVGQSVAVTMAMERGFGEIRLADFDKIELSNLNRIRTGVHNLDVSKVIVVAREISEIDPFLKVVCYHEGLTENNMDDFYTKGGKLDIIIDECDDVAMKIRCRQKAKSLRIPVVMEASDRGTIDIERFDLDPNRPILHGFVDHLDIEKVKLAKTNKEKVPYILAIANVETISERGKASMLEVGQTITSWPQLASAVALGGAISTDVCRRIALNQFTDSGRYFIDLEELIANRNNNLEKFKKTFPERSSTALKEELTLRKEHLALPKGDTIVGKGKIALDDGTIEQLVSAAILAPSGGNCQPWKWIYQNDLLYLFHDEKHSIALLDFNHNGSHIGLGAATENLVLTAHKMGLEVHVEEFPPHQEGRLIAIFSFYSTSFSSSSVVLEPHIVDDLVAFIPERCTNRATSKTVPIDAEILKQFKTIASSEEGVQIQVFEDADDLNTLANIIGKVDRLLITNKEYHHDLMSEIRWTPEENEATRDGIDIETADLSPTDMIGFKMAKNWAVVNQLNRWKGGSVFEKLSKKAVSKASAIVVISASDYSKEHFYWVGRMLQRAWLFANKHNLSIQPHTGLTFLINRLIQGNGVGLDQQLIHQLNQLNAEFSTLATEGGKNKAFLFRIFVSNKPVVKSLRRNLDDVLSIHR
jgi:molybdopterin/thiamine biosynthesis adenylyltransferase